MRNNDAGKMREKGVDQAEQGEQEEKAANDDKVKVKVRVKKNSASLYAPSLILFVPLPPHPWAVVVPE